MALHICYEGVDELPDIPVERNVERLFESVVLDGCDYDRNIIRGIENGEYHDSSRFVDRFDLPLLIESLSTGSKAALCAYHCPDVIVWCIEVGANALTEIVRNCTRGSLLLRADCHFIHADVEDRQIDVICRGRHYTSLDALAEYMMDGVEDDIFEESQAANRD